MAADQPVKVTIRLADRELYRAIRHAAIARAETISAGHRSILVQEGG